MKSILVVSNSREKSQRYIEKICQEYAIAKFDVSKVAGNISIGISEVRKIKETIFLTPKMGGRKAVVIENAEILTDEAQNALLKILEEPPESTIMVLLADSLDNLLPTVISRCEIVKIVNTKNDLAAENSRTEKELDAIIAGNINTKLRMAQDNSKTKEDVLLFIERIINTVQLRLITYQETRIAEKILPEGQKIYKLIKTTSANPRLALEHFLLKSL